MTAPAYTGILFVQTAIVDADNRYPAVATLVGPGNILALGDNRGLLAQRNGDGSIRVYVALRMPETWLPGCGIDFSDAGSTRAALLALFADWAPALTAMLHASNGTSIPWPLYAYPARQNRLDREDVTLLKDAAHIMPPFTGRGANLAMLDAVELAEALT